MTPPATLAASTSASVNSVSRRCDVATWSENTQARSWETVTLPSGYVVVTRPPAK